METTLTILPLAGTKRLAPTEAPVDVKRARHAQDSSDADDDVSDQDSEIDEPATTPLSSLSARSSPRIQPCRINHLPCTYSDCPKTFNRPARLEEHLRSHTNTRPFVCPHLPCTKDFLRDSHLKRHIQSAHTNERAYVCKYEGCGKSFVTGTRLKRHYTAHEGRDRYRCDELGCGKSFRKHGTLQRHKLTEHEGKDAFTCEVIEENGTICGQGFDRASLLKLHQGRCHNTQRYWCTLCKELGDNGEMMDLPFSTYGDFQAHNRVAHLPTCNDCGTKCPTSRELNHHIETAHSGPKLVERRKFPCPEPNCDQTFVEQSNVAAHVRSVHEKQRPFVCNSTDPSKLNNVHGWDGSGACDMSYAVKANLEQHIRTAHLGLGQSKKVGKKSNQDNSRKARKKKSNPQPQGGTTTVGLLTGTAYVENPNRNIPCLVFGCQFVFTRDYNLGLHLQTKHGLGEDDIQTLKATQSATMTHVRSGDEMDIETEGDFNGSLDFFDEAGGNIDEVKDWTFDIENSAASGGPFWIGGDNGDFSGYGGTDPWGVEEPEMMMLTGEDEDMEMVDPSLR